MDKNKWEWIVEKLKIAEKRWNIDLSDLIEMAEDIGKKVKSIYGNKGVGMWSVLGDVEDKELEKYLDSYPEYYLMEIQRIVENPDYCQGCVVSGGDCFDCIVGNLYGWCVDEDSLVGRFIRKLKDRVWRLSGAIIVDSDEEVVV